MKSNKCWGISNHWELNYLFSIFLGWHKRKHQSSTLLAPFLRKIQQQCRKFSMPWPMPPVVIRQHNVGVTSQFTTEAIILQCKRSNHEGYGSTDHSNPLKINDITTTIKITTEPCIFYVVYTRISHLCSGFMTTSDTCGISSGKKDTCWCNDTDMPLLHYFDLNESYIN